MVVRHMDEGPLVLFEGGAIALSGETGEELWSHYDNDRTLDVDVTDNGEYVALYDEDISEITLLERETGQVAHEYTFDLSEVNHSYREQAEPALGPLSGVTGEAWVAPMKDSVASYDLSTGDQLWEASDVANCPDEAQTVGMSVQNDVIVAATTCYEQPEDRDDVSWVLGWDFTSEVVGLDPDNGDELWRVEHSVGEMPGESIQRETTVLPGGLVRISYLDSPDLGHSLLDVEAEEATHLGTRELLWTSPDGERLGLWDHETGAYEIQDRSGAVERSMTPEAASMNEDIVTEGFQVGLEDGVLHLEDRADDPSTGNGFARFDGFDGSTNITWDDEESMSIHSARSVPGAVVASYSIDGESGVMGLQ